MTQPAPEAAGTTAPPAEPEGGTPAEEAGQQTTTNNAGGQPQGQPEPEGGGQDAEYWKKRARENETKAKANAAAAKKLQELEDAGKTDQQRIAEETARAQAERDEARAETLRYKAAAIHHVSEANFDLLGTGTEEEIGERAKRVGGLEAAAAELAKIKAEQQQGEQQQGDGTGPVKKLAPGTPPETDSTYPTDWFPGSKSRKTFASQTKDKP